ncbi:importin-9-like [Crassostrea angulata]|uniref:importin-9-like n=1 Tax=Magallana angulata TaxID=2784310 RepID=UPI0022B09554|nr:importin-9-like [Crassostrea angulata]
MAGAGDHSRSLKEALVESLNAILSPIHNVRISGEEQVKALEVTEEFGVHLAELTVDTQGPLAIRQLSSVLLRQYVDAHWYKHGDKFREPEVPEQAKAEIRRILPVGLKESISKVRSSVAYAVSAIAHWDWPEVWPELFQILMQALTSGDPNAVHGSMRVLSEFTQDVTDTQMGHVAPVILPEMYKIFLHADTFGIRTRSRAVSIFNVCAAMIATMAEIQRGIAKQLLFPFIPQFTQAFIQALQVPDGLTSDSGLKMEIVKAITTLVKNFPKLMSQYINDILPPIWLIFTQSADFYVRTVVNSLEESDDPVDSDGEVLGFESLVYGVFEFVHVLIDTSKFRTTVKSSVNDILYYVILYMQMTDDQVRLWTNSPDQFVEDEDDDSFSYSVRISAQDILLSICSEFPEDSAPALCQAVTKHLTTVEPLKNANDPNWWKVHESCMLAMGSVTDLVTESIQSGKVQFDITGFLQSVVLADMNFCISPFLVGRSLWTASRYTEVTSTSPELLNRFLQSTVGGLHATQPPTIRISAIRAVYSYCQHLKSANTTQYLIPFLSNILDGLLSIATQFSSDVLSLCLETMSILLTVDQAFTASVESKVTPLTIAVFLKFSSDPVVVNIVQDIFKELAGNESCAGPLEHRLLPTLVSILQAPDKVPVSLPPVSLEMMETMVRAHKGPLSEVMIKTGFPAAVHCTLHTDDNAAMQNGGECLRAFLSVALEQVMAWHDEQGNNGLYYIMQVISKLLDPKTSEHTASFVGRLVSIVITKVGNQLGENLDLMLRLVLSKMQQAETLSVMESLVMVFAQLMISNMPAVLDFLTNVPGPTGKPALEFVLTEWCSRQHLFYGNYERKVCTVALCKLLLHAIQANDTRLQEIMIQGEEVEQPTSGIRTRSKTANQPVQWTTIPVLVKIYKLLINELSNQIETNMCKAGKDDEDDEEDDWEDEDADGEEDIQLRGQTLSDLIDSMAAEFNGYDVDDEEEEDPDFSKDPTYQIDLQAYLTEFLQSLSQQACYSTFSSHHNDSEKHVLRTININV